MVSLITGFPGSGKSYYAIEKIYNILDGSDKMSNDIEVIYTNINGVKFDFFPDSKVSFKKFIESDFFDYLTQCYKLYELHKNDDSVDDELVKLSKKLGYYKSLIVFDECHDFFSNQDKTKIFWLTYHRHLFHEIILLTQNKTLIHSKYRAIPEIFIEAQPRSKKLTSSTLTYKKYASFAMRKVDFFDKQSIKTRDEVFKLYQSGNKSNQKSILSKYLKLIILFVFIVFGGFYYLLNSFKVEDSKAEDIIKPAVKKIDLINESDKFKYISNEKYKQHNNNTFVISLLCDNIKGCIYLNNTYSYKYIKKFINETDSKILYRDYIYQSKNKREFTYKLLINSSNKNIQNYFFSTKDINKPIKKVNTTIDTPSVESITDKVKL